MLAKYKSQGFRSTEGHESLGVALLRMDHPVRPDVIILSCVRRPSKGQLHGWNTVWSGSTAAAKDQWASMVRESEPATPAGEVTHA